MGRSLTWGGITLRLSSEDFQPAKKDGFGPNWPISYDELSLTMISLKVSVESMGKKMILKKSQTVNILVKYHLQKTKKLLAAKLNQS